MHEFTTRRRIEFADTDQGGICHFARYPVFMETAEHELIASIGSSVDTVVDGQKIGWPRVAFSIDYKSPARFEDELEIKVRVLRKGTKSMTYGFTLSTNGREVCNGKMTSVCCVLEAGEKIRAIPIPAQIADALSEAPE
jgi:YbgC/YbaW family acyl-CoA thioester hydrolase